MYFSGTKCGSLIACCLLSLSLMAKDVKTMNEGQGLKKPLCFVENKGEVVDQNNHPRYDIQYKLATPGMTLYVGNGQLHYQFMKVEGTPSLEAKMVTYRMDVALSGANPNATIETSDKQAYYENYYLEGRGTNGYTVNSFNKVTYKNVYPNIDWVLYIKNGKVEYDFNVHPGGNANDIKLVYDGATSLKVNKDGSVSAETPLGNINEKTPYAYELNTGKQVTANFKLHGNTLSFETGKHEGTVVIDPALMWSTYYGGTATDVATCIAESPGGNTYVGGYSSSPLLTTTGSPFMATYQGGTYDAFLAKYSPTGVLLYATYVGGGGTDQGTSIALESSGGNVYLAGSTTSNPVVGTLSTVAAYHTSNGGGNDGFLIKFDNLGARQWCTFFGGPGGDNINAVTVDPFDNVYIAGQTGSTINIATVGAYQTARSGTNDAFIAKFDPTGAIQWSTYYGGTAQDLAMGITTSPSGGVFVAGQTSSVTAMASTGAFQTILRGTNDAFIAMFDGAGNRIWGSYFGGTGTEVGNGIACDPISGNIAIIGNTTSVSNIASTNAHQATFSGIQDAFMAYFDPAGNRVWSTYYGGTAFDYGQAICFDNSSNVIAAGGTFSTSGISSPGSTQSAIGGDYDAFIVKMNDLGQRVWGTYFGGAFYDYANGVAIDPSGQLIISGYTTSTGLYTAGGLVTAGASQPAYGGGIYDAFVAKFEIDTFAILDRPYTDTIVCAGGTLFVPYTVYPIGATYQPGNVFTIQLSNAAGSFAAPVNIGSVTATFSGIVTCTIPPATLLGTGYKIRLLASNPAYTSPDDYMNIEVRSSIPVSTAFASTPVCVGNTIFLYDTATYSVMSYNWSGPAGFSSPLQFPTIPLVTMANAGTYTVTVVHNGCPASTATVTVNVTNVIPPTPIITAANGCAGYTMNLYSDPDTIATPITYSWFGPGGFTSTMQNPTILSATIGNTGYYFVHDTINGCQSMDTFVYVTVNPVIPVFISINASSPYHIGDPGDTICAGTSVTFNAIPINGGSSPSFQWMTGPSSPVVGAITNTWTSSSLVDGAGVFCVLKSSVQCPSPVSANSNVIKMNVISNTPTIYISASPGIHVSPGSNITFSSYVYNAGIDATYQWTKNGNIIPGATNTTYTLVGVTHADTIALTVTNTMNCVANPTGTSNKLVVMTNVGVLNISAALANISLSPNPNNGSFNVKGKLETNGSNTVSFDVTNMLGQTIYNSTTAINSNELNETIDMANIPSGIYLLRVSNNGESKIFRFVVER